MSRDRDHPMPDDSAHTDSEDSAGGPPGERGKESAGGSGCLASPVAGEAGDALTWVRRAGASELLKLVRDDSAKPPSEPVLRALLENPLVTREVLSELAMATRLHSSHEVRALLVAHRLMPEVQALRLLPTLYWNALVKLGANVRVRPAIRRAADRRLMVRLPALSVGEKVNLARRVGPGAMAALCAEPQRAVVEALLVNPRLTEAVLLPALRGPRASRVLLESVGRHTKWSQRYPVRVAVCLQPATPPTVSLALVAYLKKGDLRLVARDLRLPAPLRKRAELLLGRA